MNTSALGQLHTSEREMLAKWEQKSQRSYVPVESYTASRLSPAGFGGQGTLGL